MKVLLIFVGKTSEKDIDNLILKYADRLKHYNIGFSILTIPDLRNNKNMSRDQQKIMEGLSIYKLLTVNDTVILLDEHGKERTSVDTATWLGKKMNTSTKRLVFIIGGPYGFSDKIYNRANEMISLSKMTFSHQMVRVIFLEQLYRAMTIINNEPYHHN